LYTEATEQTQRATEFLCNSVPACPVGRLLCILCATAFSCSNPYSSSPPKTPKEELKTFQIDEGLHVQLVASEPMVEDPMTTNQGKQDNVQDDGNILMSDAPNAEERDDALNDPGVEGKKVQLHLFSYLHFSSILYCVNRLLLLFAE
jgi:hypothetical protein